MPRIHQLNSITPGLVPLNLRDTNSINNFRSAFAELGSVDLGNATIGTWYGETPWEYHKSDEFLYVLDGQVTITLLEDDSACDYSLTSENVFVVPACLWHRSCAEQPVTMLSVLPSAHGPVSYADDPRENPSLTDVEGL